MKVTIENIINEPYEDQLKIRDWRNSQEVAQYFLIPYISIDSHKNWLKKMHNNNPTSIAFFIKVDGVKIGVFYLHSIDYINKTAEPGIFIAPEYADAYIGVSNVAVYLGFEYIFNQLNMEKINAEVLDINKKVLKWDKKFGYKEEGIKRGNIVKNNIRHNVHMLGMFKYEWEEAKKTIYELVKDYI